jgi:hypothetical protein
MGTSIKLVGKGLVTGQVHEPILDAGQVATLEATPEKAPFDGGPQGFRLGIEALRLGLAYEYDPYFALSIARVDPLPHQVPRELRDHSQRRSSRELRLEIPGRRRIKSSSVSWVSRIEDANESLLRANGTSSLSIRVCQSPPRATTNSAAPSVPWPRCSPPTMVSTGLVRPMDQPCQSFPPAAEGRAGYPLDDWRGRFEFGVIAVVAGQPCVSGY